MAVFGSAKMSHQWVRMKLGIISQVVLSLICADALTLIAPISYCWATHFTMKCLCLQLVYFPKCIMAFFPKIKQKQWDSLTDFVSKCEWWWIGNTKQIRHQWNLFNRNEKPENLQPFSVVAPSNVPFLIYMSSCNGIGKKKVTLLYNGMWRTILIDMGI